MPKIKFIIFAAGFLMGIPTGILLNVANSGQRSASDSQNAQTDVATTRAAKSANAQKSEGKISRELTTLRNGTNEERDRFMETATAEQAKKLLDELVKSAGPFGFGNEDRKLLNQLLSNLAEHDLDTAVSWIKMHINHPDEARGLLDSYLSRVWQKSDEEAKELISQAIQANAQEGMELFHWQQLLRCCASKFPDLLIEAMRHVPMTTGGGTRNYINFPENFDFAGLAQVIADRQNEADEGMDFSEFPYNMYREWAKKDFDQAMDFVEKHYFDQGKELESFAFSQMLETRLYQLSEEDGINWTRDLMMAEGIPDEPRREFLGGFWQSSEQSFVKEALSQISDSHQRQQLVAEIYRSGMSWANEDSERRRLEALELFDSAADRLSYLKEEVERSKMPDYRQRTLSKDLKTLGHSDEEINGLFPQETEEQ